MKNDELTPEKETAIKKLLKVTNAVQLSEFTINLFLKQMMEILEEPGNVTDPKIFDIAEKEAKKLIHEEVVIKESLHLLMYPIYHKYLTLKEINGLIKFNETSLGRKIISANPKIIQESMKIGQIWGQELNLKFQERMSKVLEKES